MKPRTGSDDTLRCSFRHKPKNAVAKLISSPVDSTVDGPRAYICDECVTVCNSIMEHDRSHAQSGVAPARVLRTQEAIAFLGEIDMHAWAILRIREMTSRLLSRPTGQAPKNIEPDVERESRLAALLIAATEGKSVKKGSAI